ncbi:Uncharacterised protein [Pseudomonas putida]|nr:Uncharacterised protein [Pseudomonas putida]
MLAKLVCWSQGAKSSRKRVFMMQMLMRRAQCVQKKMLLIIVISQIQIYCHW